jgi:hypothetical protein
VAGRRRGGARAGILAGAVAALAALPACEPWRCDFESHGACVEFTRDPPDLALAQARMDALLALELPYWGLSSLAGWRIQIRDSAEYPCYFADRNEGCTDYVAKTLSVRLPPDARGCFEAVELLHELGHYELGDPMHSNRLWDGIDAQFSRIVWDRPDAPPECVERYGGITTGVWPVRRHAF